MFKAALNEIKIMSKNEEKNLLSNIKFHLEPNQIFTILGKNGSGKSTLIRALTGLLDKRFYSVSGEVIFNGKNIFSMDQKSLLELRRDKIKYIFQDAVNSFDHLKKLKYYFNSFVKDRKEIEPLLEYFLLPKKEELFKLYPYEVSGGMAQRISFVLALLTHPQIIFLDEPTSGIDSAIANLFLLKMKEFVKRENNSIIIVMQDLLFAKKASDKIAYLSNGTLSEFQFPDKFFIANQKTFPAELLIEN